MAGIELAKAYVSVQAVAGQGFSNSMSKVKGEVSGHMLSLGRMMGPAMAAAGGAFAVSKVMAFGEAAVQSYAEAEEASARLSGVLKATGGAAGYSQGQLEKMASSLQATTVNSDEAIMAGQAKLLTYKSIAGETFERAMKAATDLSAVGFGSVESASNMLGKALENPVQGLGALTRVGVTFSAAQQAQIKDLASTNQLLEAQKIIMAAVEGQVLGTAEAIGKSAFGQMKIMQNLMDDTKEKIGAALMPIALGWNQIKLKAFESVAGIIDYVSQLVTNWDLGWAIIRDSTLVASYRLMGILQNYFSQLFTMRVADLKAGIHLSEGFFKISLAQWQFFATTVGEHLRFIRDMWNAMWTDSTMIDAFSNFMRDTETQMLQQAISTAAAMNTMVGKVQADYAGVDLMKSNGWMREADRLQNMIARNNMKLADRQIKAEEQAAPAIGQVLGEAFAEVAAKETAQAMKEDAGLSGLFGLGDLGKRIQESLLGGKDRELIQVGKEGNAIQQKLLQKVENLNPGLT